MEQLSSTEFRRNVGEYLNQTYYAGKSFTLIRNGKAIAAVIPMATLELLQKLEAKQPLDQSLDNITPLDENAESGH